MSDLKVTPEEVYLNRRQLMQAGAGLAGAVALNPLLAFAADDGKLVTTKEELATGYNNFYEFSLEKEGVKPLALKWKVPSPWKIEIAGLTDAPKTYTLDELIKMAGGTDERVYRFRCVEAWSMVVPWTGFSLGKLIAGLKPKKSATHVAFTSYADKKDFPNITKMPNYPWPYTEGLTLEEAKHPLTLIATGLYGKPMPQQNGAPCRLVVPWKYGFKSIKSIVKIEFTDKQPKTLWSTLAPDEYGFYANVNPQVDHPRWSQSTERVLDGKFFPTRIKTLKFNGYEKDVASLYAGLDLKKNY